MKLPNHVNYLYPNIEDMSVLYFYHNISYDFMLLAFEDLQVESHISPHTFLYHL